MQNYKEKDASVTESFNQARKWTLATILSLPFGPLVVIPACVAYLHYRDGRNGEAELEKMRKASRSNKESKPSLP